MARDQEGLHLIAVLVVILVLGVSFVGWHVFQTNKKPATSNFTKSIVQSDEPLVLKSIGFDLDYYDPATNHAGDMEFTNVDHTLSGHNHQIWQDFGMQDTRTTDTTKKN